MKSARILSLALTLALAAPLAAEDETEAKGGSLEYVIGASALSVFNGGPLSYSPFELGWRFHNGLRVRSGIDLFYYEGLEGNELDPALGIRLYSYDMLNWRSSLLYAVPLPGKIRPLAGFTFEAVRGTRKLAEPGLISPTVYESWGFLGSGVVLGGEWQFHEHWSLELLARYTISFGTTGAVSALGFNTAYLF